MGFYNFDFMGLLMLVERQSDGATSPVYKMQELVGKYSSRDLRNENTDSIHPNNHFLKLWACLRLFLYEKTFSMFG